MGYDVYWKGALKVEPPLKGSVYLDPDAELRELDHPFIKTLAYLWSTNAAEAVAVRDDVIDIDGAGRVYYDSFLRELRSFVVFMAEQGRTLSGEIVGEQSEDGYETWKFVVEPDGVRTFEGTTVFVEVCDWCGHLTDVHGYDRLSRCCDALPIDDGDRCSRCRANATYMVCEGSGEKRIGFPQPSECACPIPRVSRPGRWTPS